MGYILDVIVIAIVAFCAFRSAKRGFMRTAIELAGFALAIILAFNFAPAVSDAAYDGLLDKTVTKKIATAIDERTTDSTTDITEAVWDSVPGFIASNIEYFGITEEEVNDKLSEISGETSTAVAADISHDVVRPVVSAAISGLVGLLIFIVISILAKFLAIPINKLCSFSLVGKLNKTLGAVLGAGKGVIFAAIFFLIISSVVVLTGSGFLIFTRENIDSSALAKLICEFNPIF